MAVPSHQVVDPRPQTPRQKGRDRRQSPPARPGSGRPGLPAADRRGARAPAARPTAAQPRRPSPPWQALGCRRRAAWPKCAVQGGKAERLAAVVPQDRPDALRAEAAGAVVEQADRSSRFAACPQMPLQLHKVTPLRRATLVPRPGRRGRCAPD